MRDYIIDKWSKIADEIGGVNDLFNWSFCSEQAYEYMTIPGIVDKDLISNYTALIVTILTQLDKIGVQMRYNNHKSLVRSFTIDNLDNNDNVTYEDFLNSKKETHVYTFKVDTETIQDEIENSIFDIIVENISEKYNDRIIIPFNLINNIERKNNDIIVTCVYGFM